MFSSLKQFIATSLLVILAFSCSGLSFGMIGHKYIQMEGIEHKSKVVHDCCGVTDADQGESSAATGIDHHTPTVAILSFLDLLTALFFIVFVGVTLPEPVRKIVVARPHLYARAWLERWSYFALYFRRLFSRGILHPKTW